MMTNDEELKTCMASELVAALQEKIAEHGDLPIYAVDADTDWSMPIGLMFAGSIDLLPDRFEITSNYYGRPEGDLS